jgi:CNT family concentrative nucleoside transporter
VLVLNENGVNYSFTHLPAPSTNNTSINNVTTPQPSDSLLIRILRGLLGISFILVIAWFFSENRRMISWNVVAIGLGMQILLAFLIVNPAGLWLLEYCRMAFELLGKGFVNILDFSKEGTKFLFSSFLDVEKHGFLFAFQVLPTIIFFSALTSVLFYLGIIQKVVYVLAIFLTKALRLSGAESLSVAGNIFLGQTESPLMIKAYLEKMTRSEMLLVMTGGMATLAGGVLAAYIAFLGGDDPVEQLKFAKHLLAASFMAAPGAVIVSKILVPQTESIDSNIEITKEKIGSNVLDAISNGTVEGLKLAVNVASMLLVFIAFIAMANFFLIELGAFTGLNGFIEYWSDGQFKELSLQVILGYVFAPFMWMLGVCPEDIILVGRLIGEKVIMTEFIGYISLSELKTAGAFAQEKSITMATYMLCGFANFASIGIQIGGIGSLAPGKRKLLSEFGLKALLAGTLASLLSATIIGMLLG